MASLTPRSSCDAIPTASAASAAAAPTSSSGSGAMIELGVATGLTMVFALLRQNWSAAAVNPGGVQLCNDVLRSALDMLRTFQPLVLAPSVVVMPKVGLYSLEQINAFLARCSKISETKNQEGSR